MVVVNINLEHFQDYIIAEGLSKNTIYNYMQTYAPLCYEYLNPPTQDGVVKVVNMKRRSSMARAAVKKWLEFYSSYTGNNQYRLIVIPKRKGKVKNKIPKFLNKNEIAMIYYSNKVSAFDKLLIFFLLETGCRVTELLNIKVKHLAFTEGNRDIFVEKSKTGERYVRVSNELKSMLEQHISRSKLGNEDYIIPFRSRQRVNQKMMVIGDEVLGHKINPHSLRHTCGFMMANNKVDLRVIQEYLGHSNINNTVIYTKIMPEKVQKEFDRVFDGDE